MKMAKLLMCLIFVTTATLAQAEMRQSEESIHLSVPGALWELKFPKQGWKLTRERVTQNGHTCYYTFSNANMQLNASFIIEPADKRKTSQDYRSMYLSNSGPLMISPQSVEQFEQNGFAIAKFIVPIVYGIRVNQLNYSGHMVRDGYRIDMHLCKMRSQKGDERLLSGFIETIFSRQKLNVVPTMAKN